MASVRGVLTGALALVAFETLVQPQAAQRTSGLAVVAGNLAQRLLNPSVPAFSPRGANSDVAGGFGASLPDQLKAIGDDDTAGSTLPAPAYPNPTVVPTPVVSA